MKTGKPETRNAWTWIPSLYFAEGLPYILVTSVSGIMYKKLGIPNADITFYISLITLTWVIKPLWSPIVDILKTKRYWIITAQLIIGLLLLGVTLTISLPHFFEYTLLFFMLIAFGSATHDIAADGFYMLALSEKQQSFFVGIRSTFYRIALIAGGGLVVILAGALELSFGLKPVEINVTSNPDKFITGKIDLDSIKITPLPGEMRIVAKPKNIDLSTKPVTEADAGFVTTFAHNMNVMNKFEEGEKKLNLNQSEQVTGNVALVYFHLSKKPEPGVEYNIDVSQKSGQGFSIIQGQNFTFTDQNWNKPAFSVIQIDTTIHNRSQAVFNIGSGNVPIAWVITFGIVALLFILLSIFHRFIFPYPKADKISTSAERDNLLKNFFSSFISFIKKENFWLTIGFLLLYRLGEAQLDKIAPLFILDSKASGGLGLSTIDLGFLKGTIGMLALVLGGILGGIAVARKGLRYWLWAMIIAINLPDVVYVYLAFFQPSSLVIISICIAIEQFGYGFGFTAYMMYMIYISQGEFKTSHYAIATGFMALGLAIPGAFSGMLQTALGYKSFFVWVLIATIPSFLIAKFVHIDALFGIKKNDDVQLEES